MWLVSGSVPLFVAFGIRVRAHASLIVFIVITLLLSDIGAQNAVVSMTILFGSVLLHEFGHCFAARWVGGHAEEILMWPLGGLASVDPPHRPLPSFITTAAGPAVNLVICILTGTAIAVLNRSAYAVPWFPVQRGLRSYIPHDWTTYYLWWIFLINYALMLFNLLMVFYPFDGGRMVQEILWAIYGYYKSMRFAVVTGMVGAVLVAMIGIATWSFMLVLIAIFGFVACLQQRRMLLEAGPYGFDEVD
jgi:Zn-dependent protease